MAKQIRMVAAENADDATTIAQWGRLLSKIEQQIQLYYIYLDFQKKTIAGESTLFSEYAIAMKRPYSREIGLRLFEKAIPRHLAPIVAHFVEALNNCDSRKIREIAEAVDFVKFYDKELADKYRAEILIQKSSYQRTGQRLTLKQMANRIGWPQNHTKDGLSQLRRLCKELGYPLVLEKTNKPSGRP